MYSFSVSRAWLAKLRRIKGFQPLVVAFDVTHVASKLSTDPTPRYVMNGVTTNGFESQTLWINQSVRTSGPGISDYHAPKGQGGYTRIQVEPAMRKPDPKPVDPVKALLKAMAPRKVRKPRDPYAQPKPAKVRQGRPLYGFHEGKPCKLAEDYTILRAPKGRPTPDDVIQTPWFPGPPRNRKERRANMARHFRPDGVPNADGSVDHVPGCYAQIGENTAERRGFPVNVGRGNVKRGIRASDGGAGTRALSGATKDALNGGIEGNLEALRIDAERAWRAEVGLPAPKAPKPRTPAQQAALDRAKAKRAEERAAKEAAEAARKADSMARTAALLRAGGWR